MWETFYFIWYDMIILYDMIWYMKCNDEKKMRKDTNKCLIHLTKIFDIFTFIISRYNHGRFRSAPIYYLHNGVQCCRSELTHALHLMQPVIISTMGCTEDAGQDNL
jgi:hypothetical protein